MSSKSITALIITLLLAAGAATFRFGDSAHALGLLSRKGGEARHGFMLESGKPLYALIATATVLPPVRGDIRVALEGEPAMDYAIYDSAPVIDLGVFRRPRFEKNVLRGVEPRDRLALWVVMKPSAPEASGSGWLSTPTPLLEQSAATDNPLALVFTEVASHQELLRIPVVFTAAGGAPHGH